MNSPIRFQYHFEPEVGWMNDPNGLIYYKGHYHAFYQHYPYAPRWGQMHWGHAVSDDLIHWQELPVALYPDMPYENDGGCFSGSAIERDGRLYLFYTSVSHELGQTQSVAYSDDGIHFTKFAGNPIISQNPTGTADFRDPKVTYIDGKYYMVVGSGDEDCGRVLLFNSDDLLNWSYAGILFEDKNYAPCIECPDFFKLEDRYILMFSKINEKERATVFVVGDFSEGKLTDYSICRPEWGPDFYAAQTFSEGTRRIMIGWMYHWGKEAPLGSPFAGALSIPRELKLVGNEIRNFPVTEAGFLLSKTCAFVSYCDHVLTLSNYAGEKLSYSIECLKEIDVLEDRKSIEVFINRGEQSFSLWLL